MSIISMELNSTAFKINKSKTICRFFLQHLMAIEEGKETSGNSTTDTIIQPQVSVPAHGLRQPHVISQPPVITNPAHTVVNSNGQQFLWSQ